MNSPLVYTLGTVTLERGSADILGNGTGWAINGVRGGDMTVEVAGGNTLVLASVDDDTHATAATKWMGPSGTFNYAISLASADAADAVWTSRHFSRIVGQGMIAAIPCDDRGTLAERDALDPVPSNGFLWLRVEVGYDLEIYKKVSAGWEGPFPARGAGGEPGADGLNGQAYESYPISIFKADGIDAGGYFADRRANADSTQSTIYVEIVDGDPGSEIDIYLEVAGNIAWGPVAVEQGTPFLATELAIAVSEGDAVNWVITSVDGGVRAVFAKCYGAIE